MVETKVTLALVFALAVEAAGVLIWTGSAAERLKEVELRVAAQAEMAERLARVEAHLDLQTAQLDRIETKLDAR